MSAQRVCSVQFYPPDQGENEMKTRLIIAVIIVLTLIAAARGKRNKPAPTPQLKSAETAVSVVAETPASEPIVTPTTKHSARPDPAAFVLAYQDALNAHDMDTALALFSDDLEYHDFGGLILDKGYMSESLNVWNPRLAQAEAIDIEVNGNKVEWLMRFIQRSGSIDEFQFEAIVEDGKITSLTELAVSIGSYSHRNPQYRGYFRRTAPTLLA
jgi:hypothetical protein